MLDVALVAFTTLFATIGPIDVAVMFAAMTAKANAKTKRRYAYRGVGVATILLLAFALAGQSLLNLLGISLPALRVAGGILLLLIGIDLVFARSSGSVSTTEDETQEAMERNDISIFPLATPLIAGPGAIGAVILLMANHHGDYLAETAILLVIILLMLITLVALLLATQITRYLGVTGIHVISRIFGILLSALAVQFIFDGIIQSRIFHA